MARWGIFSSADYAGVDQGVDFRGSGPVPALDSGVVTDVGRASIVEGGTYPYVVYRLNAGPYKGQYVYLAENFTPLVHKGERLKQGQAVGMAKGSYPYIEIGFNKTAGGWNAVAPLGGATPAGQAMKSYIYGLIGQAPPVTVPNVGASYTGPTSPYSGTERGAASAASSAVAAAKSTASFFGELTSASFWLRALEVVGGFIILMLGLYLLARQAGVQAPQPPAPGLSEEALAQLQKSPGTGAAQAAPRRRRRTVRHEASDRGGERTAELKRRAAEADPSTNEIPF